MLHLKAIIPLFFMFAISSVIAFASNAEKLNFSVFYGSQRIGSLTVKSVLQDQQTIYHLKFEITISFMLSYHIVEDISDTFIAGQLHASSQTRYINEEQKVKHTLVRNTNGYALKTNGKQEKLINKTINATVTSLYFAEPNDKDIIYSQNFQQLFPIKTKKPHLYELKLPNGTATYSYHEGKLHTVISDTGWDKVHFIREH